MQKPEADILKQIAEELRWIGVKQADRGKQEQLADALDLLCALMITPKKELLLYGRYGCDPGQSTVAETMRLCQTNGEPKDDV